jgi:hypothetical protein
MSELELGHRAVAALRLTHKLAFCHFKTPDFNIHKCTRGACVSRRDYEASQKAQAIGHATIRLILPFGIIVQSEFAPLDTLAHVRAFAQHRVLDETCSDCFDLFITPPKHTFSKDDLQKTLWESGLVPGALSSSAHWSSLHSVHICMHKLTVLLSCLPYIAVLQHLHCTCCWRAV